jgi:UDP-N-acetylmuramoylalanine--D-glutamate ligase
MDLKIAIVLGLGVTGLSSCRFLQKLSYTVWATDDKLQAALLKPEVQSFIGVKELEFLDPDEVIARIKKYPQCISFVLASPGVKPSHPLLAACKQCGIDYFGDIELAFRQIVQNPPPMIGVTGTNGKTTVTSLVNHILEASGLASRAVGNIGEPLLDEIEESALQKRPLVLELSSYQLETTKAKALKSAVILNITPDHLDHHASMQEYATAKLRIGKCLQPGGSLFLHEKVYREYPFSENAVSVFQYGFDTACDIFSDGMSIIRFGKKEIDLPETLKNKFSHDVENFLAAYALCRDFGIRASVCVDAFLTFKKPPHRIQFVREVAGIKFIDDSKGTNIDAVIRAVESIPEKIILIAGGVHKGESYASWSSIFQDKVKAIFAIGEAAALIQKDLSSTLPITLCKSLEDAIISSKAFAKRGETVLLSPGCASFDMFKNYKERGEKFQALVWELAEETL